MIAAAAAARGADYSIYPTHTVDAKKNPLSHDDKVGFMRQHFRYEKCRSPALLCVPIHSCPLPRAMRPHMDRLAGAPQADLLTSFGTSAHTPRTS